MHSAYMSMPDDEPAIGADRLKPLDFSVASNRRSEPTTPHQSPSGSTDGGEMSIDTDPEEEDEVERRGPLGMTTRCPPILSIPKLTTSTGRLARSCGESIVAAAVSNGKIDEELAANNADVMVTEHHNAVNDLLKNMIGSVDAKIDRAAGLSSHAQLPPLSAAGGEISSSQLPLFMRLPLVLQSVISTACRQELLMLLLKQEFASLTANNSIKNGRSDNIAGDSIDVDNCMNQISGLNDSSAQGRLRIPQTIIRPPPILPIVQTAPPPVTLPANANSVTLNFPAHVASPPISLPSHPTSIPNSLAGPLPGPGIIFPANFVHSGLLTTSNAGLPANLLSGAVPATGLASPDLASPASSLSPGLLSSTTGGGCSPSYLSATGSLSPGLVSLPGGLQVELSHQKEIAYQERRRKNNLAAKRSRDARRMKEDEVAIRAALLEQENIQLHMERSKLMKEVEQLRAVLLSTSTNDDITE